MNHYTIGVDISKARLDVYRRPDGLAVQFDNTAKGLKAFQRWMSGFEVERIVYEPTGKYHCGLEDFLSAAGYRLCRVNPLHARRFAQATGTRTKTDAVDARMLAVMGEALRPGVTAVSNRTMRDLRQLQIARQALVKDRTAAKNRSKSLTLPLLKRQNKARLARIKQDLAAIEQAMRALINSDEEMARKFAILCSIPGLAAITAAALIVEIPELGTLGRKQAAALAGLAPFTRQSGQWKGKSFIGAGRKFLRDSLYMPALVACRFNDDLKQFYSRLTEAGKPPKLAIAAVMRKLIVLANALVRANRLWEPERPAGPVRGKPAKPTPQRP